MHRPIALSTGLAFALALTVSIAAPAAVDATALDSKPPAVEPPQRVGGDLEITATVVDGRWRSGNAMIEEALPEGYPDPTPPGAIDIKSYPTLRRAEVTGTDAGRWGMNGGFWPLFQHIKRRDIAMTSPVEMDLDGWDGSTRDQPDGWTMAFLYRSADLGPTGIDDADPRVEVVDTAPLTVVAVGVQGAYGMRTASAGMAELSAWLDDTTEWVRAGAPRVLYYNGPSVANRRKWAEVQVPIARAPAAETTETDVPARSASEADSSSVPAARGSSG